MPKRDLSYETIEEETVLEKLVVEIIPLRSLMCHLCKFIDENPWEMEMGVEMGVEMEIGMGMGSSRCGIPFENVRPQIEVLPPNVGDEISV